MTSGYEDGPDGPDGYEDDAAGTMVRPYTVTRGRTAPERDDFTLITVISTVEEPLDEFGRPLRPQRLQPEHRLILDRCRRPMAVAEVAAALGLPVSVAKILLADLVGLGLLTARAPLSMARAAGGAPHSLLAAVRDGIRRL
ncbi:MULTISPECIES: DUF742 domain-containing protein [Streptomyces]|uniref:DUF742 domain-containing protein n=1 Tax=Streptomyces hydrogenans TaxID=1873719 RepID=A0ABQ3PDD0_9ACTN|nr:MULTISPECIES: DUF742 domain-containing protein [Streptomyces]GHE27345.1 hypothetical protein GCM10018784_76760 [Streptomyces hydrogenans]GHI23031.1 hypothetical protein Shyd_44020 [Streptomyces hydrogenans]